MRAAATADRSLCALLPADRACVWVGPGRSQRQAGAWAASLIPTARGLQHGPYLAGRPDHAHCACRRGRRPRSGTCWTASPTGRRCPRWDRRHPWSFTCLWMPAFTRCASLDCDAAAASAAEGGAWVLLVGALPTAACTVLCVQGHALSSVWVDHVLPQLLGKHVCAAAEDQAATADCTRHGRELSSLRVQDPKQRWSAAQLLQHPFMCKHGCHRGAAGLKQEFAAFVGQQMSSPRA